MAENASGFQRTMGSRPDCKRSFYPQLALCSGIVKGFNPRAGRPSEQLNTPPLQEVRMKTSEYLTHYLKDADDNFNEDVPDAEPHEHPSIFAENIVRLLLDTLEGFVPTSS